MKHSWEDLQPFRGSLFHGQWPTIPELFEISAAKYPRRPCFTVFSPEKNTLTFEEAHLQILKSASVLMEMGIGRGDHVVLYGKNSPEWALAYLAVLFAGGIIVPIDHQLSLDRMLSLAAYAEAALIITSGKRISQIREQQGPWEVLALDGIDPFTARSPKELRKKVLLSDEATAAVLFTSGTTGNEKGVILTHRNFITDVYQACDPDYMTACEEDVFFALLPLHHSYAMTAVFLEQLKHGGELVFASSFAISRIISDMQRSKVSIFMGIPMIYNKLLTGLLKEIRSRGLVVYAAVRLLMSINGVLKKTLGWNPGRKYWFRKILEGIGFYHNHLCICGGGPLPVRTYRLYQQLGLDFAQGYGLTETSPIITLNPKDHFKIDSVGKVFPFIDLKIKDKDSSGVGEICVKGPNVTSGYLKDREHTEQLFDAEGYLRTGDLGTLDEQRYLYLHGRKKNLIVTSGGKNIYPEELEDAFQLYEEIGQIMVRSNIPDTEEIEALIHPNEDSFTGSFEQEDAVEKRIRQIVREVNRTLPHYKKISRVTILEQPMDMTTSRKIQRSRVNEKLSRPDAR